MKIRISRLSILLFFCNILFVGTLSLTAYADVTCEIIFQPDIVRSEYSQSDFPGSRFTPRILRGHKSFAKWAAEQANWVAQESGSLSLEEIFARVSSSRFVLALKQGLEDSPQIQAPWDFGILRNMHAISTVDIFDSYRYPRSSSLFSFLIRALKLPRVSTYQRKMKDFSAAQSPKINNAWLALTNTYVFRDRTTAQSTWLAYNLFDTRVGKFSIYHPDPATSALIFADAIMRLDYLLRTTRATNADTQKEFLYSLWGFFNAMPYLRGSSSIGRIVFSGIHLKIFGKKLIIPEEADQIAMLTNFEEFRGFMIKHMITN